MKKIVLAILLATGSTRALAADLIIRVSNRVFHGQIPENVNVERISNVDQLIDLLKDSEVEEIKHKPNINVEAIPPTFTDPLGRPIAWTEPRARPIAWTEPRATPVAGTETKK